MPVGCADFDRYFKGHLDPDDSDEFAIHASICDPCWGGAVWLYDASLDAGMDAEKRNSEIRRARTRAGRRRKGHEPISLPAYHFATPIPVF